MNTHHLAIFCAAALAIAVCPRAHAADPNCTLRIHVDGFRNSKGNLGTVIFRSPDGWPESTKKAFHAGPAPIKGDPPTATAVWHLPEGDYAIAAIHDQNSNKRLDRNMFGIPKEGFGFANNPEVSFSAPGFEAAKVHVACPSTDIDIHLEYK